MLHNNYSLLKLSNTFSVSGPKELLTYRDENTAGKRYSKFKSKILFKRQ